jgi:hypothetical protein
MHRGEELGVGHVHEAELAAGLLYYTSPIVYRNVPRGTSPLAWCLGGTLLHHQIPA